MDNEIFLINEELHVPLLHIANKLLGRQNLNFDQLTPNEQQLWNLFKKSDIYEFLTGETDTTPEFRHNYITCSAKPKVTLYFHSFVNDLAQANLDLNHQPPPVQHTQSAPSQVQHFLRERDIYKFLTGETDTTAEFRYNYITCSAKPRVTFDFQGFVNYLAQANLDLNHQPPPVQRTQSALSQVQHFHCDRKNMVNYRALHLGQELQQVSQELKQKCQTMCKSAKATVTKLAPGAFSPKPAAPATTPSSPATTSSSSWKFWPSK